MALTGQETRQEKKHLPEVFGSASMDASEDTASMASAEEPKVQDVTALQGDELELALANMTVEGAFIAYSNALRIP